MAQLAKRLLSLLSVFGDALPLQRTHCARSSHVVFKTCRVQAEEERIYDGYFNSRCLRRTVNCVVETSQCESLMDLSRPH